MEESKVILSNDDMCLLTIYGSVVCHIAIAMWAERARNMGQRIDSALSKSTGDTCTCSQNYSPIWNEG